MLSWFTYRRLSIAIAAFITFSFYGCGESRIAQCHKLNKVANKTKNITPPKNAKEFERIADDIANLSEEMQALKLEDPKLQDFRSRLASVYSESAQAAREIGKASSANKQSELDRITKETKANGDREGKLIGEINQYCAAP